MSAEIFVETSGREHEKEPFPGRRSRLAFRTKKQGRPQRFKLSRIFLGNWWTTPTHTWFGSGTDRKRRHWHTVILAKGHESVKMTMRLCQSGNIGCRTVTEKIAKVVSTANTRVVNPAVGKQGFI